MRPTSTIGIVVLFLVSGAATCWGQQSADLAAQREAMQKVDFLVGQWKGESWTEIIPGHRQRSEGTESVESKLDGLLLTIEGVHRRKEGEL